MREERLMRFLPVAFHRHAALGGIAPGHRAFVDFGALRRLLTVFQFIALRDARFAQHPFLPELLNEFVRHAVRAVEAAAPLIQLVARLRFALAPMATNADDLDFESTHLT